MGLWTLDPLNLASPASAGKKVATHTSYTNGPAHRRFGTWRRPCVRLPLANTSGASELPVDKALPPCHRSGIRPRHSACSGGHAGGA